MTIILLLVLLLLLLLLLLLILLLLLLLYENQYMTILSQYIIEYITFLTAGWMVCYLSI